jgi:hypothetical protein
MLLVSNCCHFGKLPRFLGTKRWQVIVPNDHDISATLLQFATFREKEVTVPLSAHFPTKIVPQIFV